MLAARYAAALKTLRSRRPNIAVLITESNPSLLAPFAERTLEIERGDLTELAGASAPQMA